MLLAAALACRWPHPFLPGLPATSASGPHPGFHLACYCRRWAGRPTPRAGSQEKGPTGKTLGKRNRPPAASHHHHPLSLLLQIDLWVELRLSRRCPLTHRHLCANTASQACRHNQPFSEPHILSPACKATQPPTPSLSHPAPQHHQTQQTPHTHRVPCSLRKIYTVGNCPCACPVTQTCTASLGVYNCPRHNQASSILGVLVLGGRSLNAPCVCSSRTLQWTSLILVLSVCWSYDKPIWGGCHPNSLALLQSGPLGRQVKVRTSPRDSLLPQPSGDSPPSPASESRHRHLKGPHCSLQCLPCTFLIWCW